MKVICNFGDPTDLQDLKITNPQTCRSAIILPPDTGKPDAALAVATFLILAKQIDQILKALRACCFDVANGYIMINRTRLASIL